MRLHRTWVGGGPATPHHGCCCVAVMGKLCPVVHTRTPESVGGGWVCFKRTLSLRCSQCHCRQGARSGGGQPLAQVYNGFLPDVAAMGFAPVKVVTRWHLQSVAVRRMPTF